MSENVSDHLEKDAIAIDHGAAKTVSAMLEMSFGSLEVGGGADMMMEGEFEYGDPSYKPEVSYDIEGEIGRLLMRHPNNVRQLASSKQSRWHVSFNEEIPLDLGIHVASGATSVNLSDSHLTALTSKVGSGRFATILNGSMDDLEHVALKTASGRTNAVLNGTFSKLMDYSVSSASGLVAVALGGVFPTLSALDIRTASGTVDLGLAGEYPALERITVDAVSGAGDLNLVDAVFSDLTMVLNCVSGEHIVRCPSDTGVRVQFKSLTGQIEAPDFRRVEGMFVNELYGKTETTIAISVSSVSGRVSVQLGSA